MGQHFLRGNEVFGPAVSRRTYSPFSDAPFRVDIRGRRLASSGVASGISAGVCAQHWAFNAGFRARLTAEVLADGNDDILLLVHATGRRVVSQFGREATVAPGGGILVSNADIDRHVAPEPCRFVSIGLPRKLMTALAPGLEDAFIRPLPPDTGVLRVLTQYLGVLEDEHALRTPEMQRAVAMHIHDLCALAIGATRDAADVARGRGVRAARLRAIKADIVENLAAGDVSAAALAGRQGVTPRYVHKLFESEGTTLSQFVLGQRLARVHRMLADRRYGHRTIGAIAYQVGFSDLSTFNRAFRRHFGATPSDVRAAARTD